MGTPLALSLALLVAILSPAAAAIDPTELSNTDGTSISITGSGSAKLGIGAEATSEDPFANPEIVYDIGTVVAPGISVINTDDFSGDRGPYTKEQLELLEKAYGPGNGRDTDTTPKWTSSDDKETVVTTEGWDATVTRAGEEKQEVNTQNTPTGGGSGSKVDDVGSGKAVDRNVLPATNRDQQGRDKQRAEAQGDVRRPGESQRDYKNRMEAKAVAAEKKRLEDKKYYEDLSKSLKGMFGPDKEKAADFDPDKLKKDRLGGLKGPTAEKFANRPGSGGGPSSSGGASSGGGLKGSGGVPQMSALQRNLSPLSLIPGAKHAFTDAGIHVENGRISGTTEQLLEAEKNLSSLPLQAMLHGIPGKVGRPAYDKVVATVERGEGGEDTKDVTTDHNSLVWKKSCTKGLENCNKHATGTSYSIGRPVPAPSVSSIYDSLFGEDSGQDDALKNAHAKLGKSALGSSGGGSIWDRIKNAFSGISGGEKGLSANGVRMAAAGYSPANSVGIAPGTGKGNPVKMTLFGKRSLQDSGIPARVDLVNTAEGGVAHRMMIWGLAGGIGFTILLVWAFRKKREND